MNSKKKIPLTITLIAGMVLTYMGIGLLLFNVADPWGALTVNLLDVAFFGAIIVFGVWCMVHVLKNFLSAKQIAIALTVIGLLNIVIWPIGFIAYIVWPIWVLNRGIRSS